MVELALYAFIAIFIFFRLYNSLGKITNINFNAKYDEIESLEKQNKNINEMHEDETLLDLSPKNKTVVQNIKKLNKDFSLTNFMEGAQAAFEFIIKSLNSHNKEVLRSLLDEKLYNSFLKEISRREEKQVIHEDTIISIKSQTIVDLKLIKHTAYIAVCFVSEQINIVKDLKNNIVSGDPNKINKVEDIWQFRKNITDSIQKWYLKTTHYKNDA